MSRVHQCLQQFVNGFLAIHLKYQHDRFINIKKVASCYFPTCTSPGFKGTEFRILCWCLKRLAVLGAFYADYSKSQLDLIWK